MSISDLMPPKTDAPNGRVTEPAGAVDLYALTAADLRQIAAAQPCGCGGTGWVGFDVPFDHPCHGRLFRCRCRAGDAERARLAGLFGAGVPPRYRRLTFESFARMPPELLDGKGEALEAAQSFAGVEQYRLDGGLYWRGELRAGLLLFGPVGRGKTGLAAAVCRAWIEAGAAPLWITWGELVETIQREYGRAGDGQYERLDRARGADLLILDEFGDVDGAGAASNDQRRIAYRVLGHRHDHWLPTLITTNLNPMRDDDGSDLCDRFGAPIHDRVAEALCHCVPVEGPNLRCTYLDLGGPK
ncbi:MAG: ATP-binding protein [Anaerolineae bacterium]|nr:ATP-binding protein [Anaerolineae bacterium]